MAGDSAVPMTGPYRQDDVLATRRRDGPDHGRGDDRERHGRGARRSGRRGRQAREAAPGRSRDRCRRAATSIPGIIDAHSHIAAEGGINEGSLAVTSMVRVADVVDPTDIGIYRALAGGVTTINVLHGSANPIGGQNQVLKLRWGQDADGMRFEGAPPGIKFALGENPKRSRSFGQGSTTLSGDPDGRAGRDPAGVHRGRRVPGGVGAPPRGGSGRRAQPAAGSRPEARGAGRDPGRAPPGPRPQLPCRRDPAVAASGGGAWLPDRDPATRARGLPGRGRDRRPRRRGFDLLRLVGVQGGGLRSDPVQRRADDRPRRRRVDQLR